MSTITDPLTAHVRTTHPARLLGMATAFPPDVAQSHIAGLVQRMCCSTDEQRVWAGMIFDRCGVLRRGSVLLSDDAGELAPADEHVTISPGTAFCRPDVVARASIPCCRCSDTSLSPDKAPTSADDALRRVMDQFYPPPAHPADRGPTTARRMHEYARFAPPLAAAAAAAAIDDARLRAADITHLLPVSCTGFFAPGLDSALITRLGLSPSIQRLQIGFMGCHGAFNALTAARSIAMADPAARILVCCVELCTLHLAYGWDPQRVVANALFADGAAAAIVGATAGPDHAEPVPPVSSLAESNGAPAPTRVACRSATSTNSGAFSRIHPAHPPTRTTWSLRDATSLLVPDSADAMTWLIGDHGFTMTLSPRLPDLIRTGIRPWITAWLDQHGLALSDIRSWAVHPGGPKVLTAVTDALELAPQDVQVSRDVLARHGNISSATILCILDQLRRRNAPGPCLALGFGPGLMAEAMLLDSALASAHTLV